MLSKRGRVIGVGLCVLAVAGIAYYVYLEDGQTGLIKLAIGTAAILGVSAVYDFVTTRPK